MKLSHLAIFLCSVAGGAFGAWRSELFQSERSLAPVPAVLADIAPPSGAYVVRGQDTLPIGETWNTGRRSPPYRNARPGALPPSVRALAPGASATPDTSAWPGYIRHHARTDSLAVEVDAMRDEARILNETDENLHAALRALTAGMEALVIENRLIREYLKVQRERGRAPAWSDSVAARRM